MNATMPSFVAPVAPQVPTPTAQPSSQAAAASNTGFAQMLNQTQQAQQPQTEDAPASSDQAPQEAANPAGSSVKSPERGKLAKSEKVSKSESAPSRTDAAKEDAQAGEAEPAPAAETVRVDPVLAEWLSGLHLPPTTPPQETAGVTGAAGTSGDVKVATDAVPEGGDVLSARARKAGMALGASDGAAPSPSRMELRAGAESANARDAKLKAEPVAFDMQLAATQQTAAGRGERAGESVESLAAATPPCGGATGGRGGVTLPAPGTAHVADVAAPVTIQMSTPATAPEFAQSLGVQVSVLAREGVQQAELHLNPAEMGPISIQIALDGTQAQVNFGADSAATRDIIEQGLPELAASLRDAGFTLSGGGVHSQARGRDEGGEGRHGFNPGPDLASSDAETGPRRALARVAAGGIDLYA